MNKEEVRKYMNGIKKKAEGEKYGTDGIIKAKKNLPEILSKAHFGGNSGRDPDGGAVCVQRGE